MRRLGILVGEGIECEKESRRFFERSGAFVEVRELSVARLLRDVKAQTSFLGKGDFLFLPGGFSFADHFGAGRLLAYQLKHSGVFERAEALGWNVMGVCNGFQVLCAAGKFGEHTQLLANRVDGRRLGFRNLWVNLKTSESLGALPLRLPVRHGEGRLLYPGELPEGVEPFLFYCDPEFDNGSKNQIAGLRARVAQACYWGLMPHPEIAQFPLFDPDVVGAEYFERFRSKVWQPEGDGAKLWTQILEGGSKA